MMEYFNSDGEAALEALKDEVDYEWEADWNRCLAAIEASTAVGVCVDSGGDYAAAAATATVHEEMDFVWKREEGGDDEVDIEAEAEVEVKKEEEWEEKAAEALWQAVYEA